MSRNFLSEKLFDLNMSQAQLAKKLGRDPATVNRWIKNNREISSINAVELSKILKCNPSEILFGSKSSTINITKTLDNNFEVKQISINKQRKISIPYEYNNKFTVAIINQSNVYNDGQILLYDEENIDISKQMRSVGSSIIDYDNKLLVGYFVNNKVLDFSIVNPFNLEVIKGYEKINTKKIKGIYKVKAEYYPDYC
tara:strand:- start:125 stop:715 length:591 start_codon:yes stop_codon:yes gene_type:complete